MRQGCHLAGSGHLVFNLWPDARDRYLRFNLVKRVLAPGRKILAKVEILSALNAFLLSVVKFN